MHLLAQSWLATTPNGPYYFLQQVIHTLNRSSMSVHICYVWKFEVRFTEQLEKSRNFPLRDGTPPLCKLRHVIIPINQL